MTMPQRSLLIEIEPRLVSVLTRLLLEAGEANLAAQVEELEVFEREDFNSGPDFYTAPRPEGRWSPDHWTLGLSPGGLHIDVVGDRIVCVEVLWGIRGSIDGLLREFTL